MKTILGTAQLARRYGVVAGPRDLSVEQSLKIVREAALRGVEAVDTAPVYGDAELLIGSTEWEGEIHTKLDPGLPPRESIHNSLTRLCRQSLDIVYLHESAVLTRGERHLVEEAAECAAAVSAVLGVSVYEEAEFDLALALPEIMVIQVPISILDRRFAGALLQKAFDLGKTIYARSVLLQGVVTASSERLPEAVEHLRPWVAELERIARLTQISRYELALGWVASQPGISGILLGAERPEDVAEFVETCRSVRLESAVMEALNSMAMPSFRQVDPRQWQSDTNRIPSATSPANNSPQPQKVVAIVQARLGSVRFPGKVLAPILGRPVIEHLLERLSRAASVDMVILAIPDSAANDPLAEVALRCGVACFRGNEADVLSRYHDAAASHSADIVVRITGDCPLVDPTLVDFLVERLIAEDLDLITTGLTYPNGFDVLVTRFSHLQAAHSNATEKYDREHVMPWVLRNESLRKATIEADRDRGSIRVTLDEPEDLAVITAVFDHFGHNSFSITDLNELIENCPELFEENKHLIRDEGAVMGLGQKMWRHARNIIPGGSMLLSKRAEMHLPGRWPAYFDTARGCTVVDLDGNSWTDVGWMGIGTNILGYGHPAVDAAVMAAVAKGNLSTLNCAEEVLLADRLCELHPWAEMARFTRSGGEACAVAVRIARAASGKDGVAFCGYHGWHDWYLSANLSGDSALDGHLLPGLQPRGVPRALAGTAVPFTFNDLSDLQTIAGRGDIGTIIMEVERSTQPAPGFLEGVRALANRIGAVLIFDECTSGFRKVVGGTHLVLGVEPDIITLGKTLGNGYAINAVLGRSEVMRAAEETFISSTFWTERIGPSAALAALEAMVQEDAPARIDAIGGTVSDIWRRAASAAGVEVVISGLPALTRFAIPGIDGTVLKTFVAEEMLDRGFLAATACYASIAHDENVLDRYEEAITPVFATIADLGSEDEIRKRITGPLAQSDFRRLA